MGILGSFGKDSYMNWPNLLVFCPLLVFQPCHYFRAAYQEPLELVGALRGSKRLMKRKEYKQILS